MAIIRTRSRGSVIRTDELRRRTSDQIVKRLVQNFLLACIAAVINRLIFHHWPSIDWYFGFIGCFLVIQAVLQVAYAYQEIVALLERQNSLLERLLEREGREE